MERSVGGRTPAVALGHCNLIWPHCPGTPRTLPRPTWQTKTPDHPQTTLHHRLLLGTPAFIRAHINIAGAGEWEGVTRSTTSTRSEFQERVVTWSKGKAGKQKNLQPAELLKPGLYGPNMWRSNSFAAKPDSSGSRQFDVLRSREWESELQTFPRIPTSHMPLSPSLHEQHRSPLSSLLSFLFSTTSSQPPAARIDHGSSSCVGNMTLRPQPVAADGKKHNKRSARGERGGSAVITSWLGGSVAQPEPSSLRDSDLKEQGPLTVGRMQP
ncbi:unnamed protein product [Pleuronectes platessa]|uniref:Uncharacterized protein n=1 Tax=Pleuronectes platessa TaxID=8262 RepID=A0A9N7YGJ5_PLEPL|nr:unnamed protein product [Pleuronectes platessa]